MVAPSYISALTSSPKALYWSTAVAGTMSSDFEGRGWKLYYLQLRIREDGNTGVYTEGAVSLSLPPAGYVKLLHLYSSNLDANLAYHVHKMDLSCCLAMPKGTTLIANLPIAGEVIALFDYLD